MKRKSFMEPAFQELEKEIIADIEESIKQAFMARIRLFNQFDNLKMYGHWTPFERIGEIINEFEHWLEYTDNSLTRDMYQDLIDNVIYYFERQRPMNTIIGDFVKLFYGNSHHAKAQ